MSMDEKILFSSSFKDLISFSKREILYSIIKRVLDLIFSFLFLIVLFIPMLLIGLTIKLDSKGPIIYKSYRVGKNGKIFKMYKFRTMCADAEQKQPELEQYNEVAGGVIFKMKKDPRVTRVGSFLRKFSLDELPQLYNILIGDMSFVGPRPALISEVNKYEKYMLKRLVVPQGLTGEWQTHGRSGTSFLEMINLDLNYIEKKRYLLYDFYLIFRTFFVVLFHKGAE